MRVLSVQFPPFCLYTGWEMYFFNSFANLTGPDKLTERQNTGSDEFDDFYTHHLNVINKELDNAGISK